MGDTLIDMTFILTYLCILHTVLLYIHFNINVKINILHLERANSYSYILFTLKKQRGYFPANLNVGIDSENRVGKRVAHAP